MTGGRGLGDDREGFRGHGKEGVRGDRKGGTWPEGNTVETSDGSGIPKLIFNPPSPPVSWTGVHTVHNVDRVI